MIMNCSAQKQEDAVVNPRLCDFCCESIALLYCRADSAKLCLACDREVHSTNQLFTKHTRWLLCDACHSTPATIFCRTQNSVFCQNCDWESHSHNNLFPQPLHDRRPLEPFTGCPSVNELLGILGFENLSKKCLLFWDDAPAPAPAPDPAPALSPGDNICCHNDIDKDNDIEGENFYGLSDMLVWETPSVVTLDDLIMSNASFSQHSFQAMGVPPLPKNRNATCGKYKEEILSQLREMSKLEPGSGDSEGNTQPLIGIEPVAPEYNHQSVQKYENLDENRGLKSEICQDSAFGWHGNKDEVTDQGFSSTFLGSYTETNNLVPDKDSDVRDSSENVNESHEDLSHHPINTETFQTIPKVPVRELNSQERDSALSRYKEKKKTRRYDKHIRYESRKVRAESRIRIRGRFAKMGR